MATWGFRALSAIGGVLGDLVYPPACAACGNTATRHGAVCAACWSQVRFIERPYCEVLGTPFSYDLGPGMLSADAIANPPDFDRLRSAVLYDAVAQQLVASLKYRDRTDLAPMLAGWMVRAAAAELAAADCVLAIPLHRFRLFSRRFNQSAELARHVAGRSGRPFLPTAIVRRKHTRRQVGLSATARASNVRGAFAVPEEQKAALLGRHVVLIDDVYTTGATVGAAARALKRAGAGEVTVLTFARVISAPI